MTTLTSAGAQLPDRALEAHLREHLPELKFDRIQLTRLAGGQSNPTFRIDGLSCPLVLRKKPDGTLSASAHAIDREFRVLQALQGSHVPVPKALLFCEDSSVIGTAFYVMEFVPGRVYWNQSLPDLPAHDRAAVFDEMLHVLAEIHSVDLSASGLEDFGPTRHYVARQLKRWSSVLDTDVAATRRSPLRDAHAWLASNLPEETAAVLLHGDFRIDNLVFDSVRPKVLSVLDWEMSTLGDRWAELAYQLMSWRLDAGRFAHGLGGRDLSALGIPLEQACVDAYCSRVGIRPERWEYYIAYNLFRLAAILFAIRERIERGTASPDAVSTAAHAEYVSDLATQAVHTLAGTRA